MNDRVKQKKVVLGILLIGVVMAVIYFSNDMNDDRVESVSPKVQVEQKPILEQLFEKFEQDRTSYYDILRHDTIKDAIIRRYGKEYYDCVVKYCNYPCQVTKEKDEHGNIYYVTEGWRTSQWDEDGSNCIYEPSAKYFQVILKEQGFVIGSDGNVLVRQNNWKMRYSKNEFNEIDKSNVQYIYNIISNNNKEKNSYLTNHRLELGIYKNGTVALSIGLLLNSGYYTKILVRNDKTGRIILNIPIPHSDNDQFEFDEDGNIYVLDSDIQTAILSILCTENLDCTLSFVAKDGDNEVYSFNTSEEFKETKQCIGKYFGNIKAF